MNQFCKNVINFLQSEYSDGYNFNITARHELSGLKEIELVIKVGTNYTIIVGNTTMQYLFNLYHQGEYIAERKQWLWQKELIDILEGS